MDGGNHRDRQAMDLSHNLLSLARQRFRFLRAAAAGNHVNVCAGDKVIRFGGDKHHAAHRLIITNLSYQPPHLIAELSFQGIHFLTRGIDGDHRDLVRTDLKLKSGNSIHYSASTIIAAPRPPAAQAVTRPNPPPRRRNSCSVWVIIRAPVAAKGWP